MNELRIIFDPPASGAWNMAVDEALLHAAADTGQATFRVYEWAEPTLSLGYFQAAADRVRHSTSLLCPLVRRASGGGAILHDRELTYSVVLPRAASAVAAAELYELVHRTLIQTFSSLGVDSALYRATARCDAERKQHNEEPFLCFQRRTCFDLICRGEKIVGSAQRRRRGAILQHGSILLARSARAPELPGIVELTGARLAGPALARAWLPGLAGHLQLTTREGGLSENESRLAKQLAEERFASPGHAGGR